MTSVDVVRQIVQVVAEQVRWQYVAAFKPTPSSGKPKSNKVEIRLRSKKFGEVLGGKRTVIH